MVFLRQKQRFYFNACDYFPNVDLWLQDDLLDAEEQKNEFGQDWTEEILFGLPQARPFSGEEISFSEPRGTEACSSNW